ncbi:MULTISPECIES: aldo/keto reductase [Deefgea]|uniref:Aldo/keto reductase n=1 Tax=Deefgea chitinilytica TaxID=570276 RepID=A0ABS2CBA6_9NEIS|nr:MULTISPECIES: aldo/keto reductase [Deefgea]MBM5571430.1 aldo/keto reductase [Deefgea chitinilytica]MBM9888663.1 aldo/keto reductase [Deefgea sp. CFH1-16]
MIATRTLPGTELSVSSLCLGTMTFGEQNTEAEAHAQLNRAMECGINFIDTAEMYPVPAKASSQGLTELYVGSWLKQQARDKIILASKVAGPNRGMEWIRGGPQLNRAQIIAACDASLQRLNTDYIDLYQLHWPARHVPMFGQTYYEPSQEYSNTPTIFEQLSALNELVQQGKVRYIGVSNETPWGVSAFIKLAEQHNLPRICTIQNVYNLINRNYDHGLSETCHREHVSLLAYSPLAFGLLSGKYLDNPAADGRMNRFANFGQRYLKPQVTPAVAAFCELAKRHNISPTQMALAWLQSRWYIASTIIGATNLQQLNENIASSSTTLSQDLLNEIEAIHRISPSPAQ